MRSFFRKLIEWKFFEPFIIFVILINCILIGVETYFTNSLIASIQHFALLIFVFEIVIRFFASRNIKEYFSQGWNIFDLSIVLISLIPESFFSDGTAVSAIRVLRVFRILRLLRVNQEIKLIISVLVKSFSALFYNAIFFSIFLYLYSVIGVTLFKMPNPETIPKEKSSLLQNYIQTAPSSIKNYPDPYGTLDESAFTLFRVLTADDWTDVRYNLNYASDLALITVSKATITTVSYTHLRAHET